MALPLALTDAGWAVIGAVSGALVGATVGGVVDAVLSWRQETRLARAGSRLLASQLKIADAILGTAEQQSAWLKFYELPTSAWPEYRSLLASKLRHNEDFEAVADCVPALSKLSDDMRHGQTWEADDVGVKLSSQQVERIRELRKGVASAYNALARLAGHDQVLHTIHS